MRCWFSIGALSVAVGAGLTLMPTPASACGGTFCDAGPTSMPVDQSGENILFVMEGGTVEAHVQIQYRGDPEAFAWVVPVMARPEIEAGSDALFESLLTATVPTFLTNPVFEDCGSGSPRGSELGCGAEFEAASFDGEGGEFDEGGGPLPEVVERGIAGAFEYAVLEGGTVDGVVEWLDDNGYAQDDDAPAELRGYLDKGFSFVAFKLRGGSGVDEIHPVVIRYPGDEPCVPIRLTRIAATDDMGVRTFFLGDGRVAPTNYRSVDINLEAIDWQTPGANYASVVTRAVDTDEQGHAFVTEYAGASDMVPTDGLLDPRWDASRLVEASPEAAVAELELQGLLECSSGTCAPGHPLIAGVLERFLPRPAGVSFGAYYDCPSCYDRDFTAWDGGAFAEELESRIIGPAEHAVDLLSAHPHLTRLYTTLSPQEMTLDPIFHRNADLPDVSNLHRADMVFTCEGPNYVEFDDGRRLAVGGTPDPDQPAALRLEEVTMRGAPMTLLDLSEEVTAARGVWNEAQGLNPNADAEGCNCRAPKQGAAGLAWTFFLVGLGAWARRPRRGDRPSGHRLR